MSRMGCFIFSMGWRGLLRVMAFRLWVLLAPRGRRVRRVLLGSRVCRVQRVLRVLLARIRLCRVLLARRVRWGLRVLWDRLGLRVPILRSRVLPAPRGLRVRTVRLALLGQRATPGRLVLRVPPGLPDRRVTSVLPVLRVSRGRLVCRVLLV